MKQFNECELIISAPDAQSWPQHDMKEIVMAGRSNVGKSSFINTITGRKKLAYVGNTPGKTRLLNFFDINHEFVLVDVPGYGYAKLSEQQLVKFGAMMEEYFDHREQLSGLVVIVDARHLPSDDDVMMIDFARNAHLPCIVIATKMDKLKNSERHKCLKAIAEHLALPLNRIIPFSAISKEGSEEAVKAIFQIVNLDE